MAKSNLNAVSSIGQASAQILHFPAYRASTGRDLVCSEDAATIVPLLTLGERNTLARQELVKNSVCSAVFDPDGPIASASVFLCRDATIKIQAVAIEPEFADIVASNLESMAQRLRQHARTCQERRNN